jgi:hypothetical protein
MLGVLAKRVLKEGGVLQGHYASAIKAYERLGGVLSDGETKSLI